MMIHWSRYFYHCDHRWSANFDLSVKIFLTKEWWRQNFPYLQHDPTLNLFSLTICCGFLHPTTLKFSINMSYFRVPSPIFLLQTDLIRIFERFAAIDVLKIASSCPTNTFAVIKFAFFKLYGDKKCVYRTVQTQNRGSSRSKWRFSTNSITNFDPLNV